MRAKSARTSFPRPDLHQAGCGTPRASKRSRVRALVLLGVHVAVAVHIVQWQLGGRTLSPLEPSEAGHTLTTGAINAGFCLLVLLCLSTLVFGRFFCGWGCHVVAYQDASAWLLGRLGLRPRPLRSRLLAWVPVFAAVEMFVVPSVLRAVGRERWPGFAWHLTTESFWERFPGLWMALLTFFVCGFVVIWFLGAKGFCTYACPYGALFGFADRFALGRIRVNDDCEGCGHCTATCTSNVRVHAEVARFGQVVDPGCMKCMDCVSVCPKDALYFGIRARPTEAAKRSRGVRKHSTRSNDLWWREEFLAAGTFLVCVYAFRDLYGQIPFLLALAFAVLGAAGMVVLARSLRLPDLRLQHVQWKVKGRWTGAGLLSAGAIFLFLVFGVVGALWQLNVREGNRGLERAAALTGEGRAEALGRSRNAFERALTLSLVDSPELHNKLGQILFASGETAAAEEHLRRVVELDHDNRSSRSFLVRIHLDRGELDPALEELARIAEIDPEDPYLLRTLAGLARQAPDHPQVRSLLQTVGS